MKAELGSIRSSASDAFFVNGVGNFEEPVAEAQRTHVMRAQTTQERHGKKANGHTDPDFDAQPDWLMLGFDAHSPKSPRIDTDDLLLA